MRAAGVAAVLVGSLLLAGCENPQDEIRREQRARYEACIEAGGDYSYSSGAWGQDQESCIGAVEP